MLSRDLKKGFTLFELVAVIAISGVVFSLITYFYMGFIKNKLYESKRLAVFNNQILTQEYVSRYIKNALPITLKVSEDQQCVHFMSILGSGVFSSKIMDDDVFMKKVSLDKNAKSSYQQANHLLLVNERMRKKNNLRKVFSISENAVEFDIQGDNIISPAFILLSGVNRFCLHDRQLRFYTNGDSLQYVPIATNVFSDKPFSIKELAPSFHQLHVNISFGDEVLSLDSDYIIVVDHEY